MFFPIQQRSYLAASKHQPKVECRLKCRVVQHDNLLHAVVLAGWRGLGKCLWIGAKVEGSRRKTTN